MELGFIVTSKIITENTRGTRSASYLEAQTAKGQRVLIGLNNDSFVAVHRDEPSYVVEFNLQRIPYDIMIRSLECAGMEVCGVVLKCDEHICVLQRDDEDLLPKQIDLIIQGSVAQQSDQYMAYPLVRIEDILNDPDVMKAAIDRSWNNLSQINLNRCEEKIGIVRNQIDKLVHSFNHFLEILGGSITSLQTSQQTLNQYYEQYQNSGSIISEIQKYEQLLRNIAYRNNKMEELTIACRTVFDKVSSIEETNSVLTDVTEFLVPYKDLNALIE